MCIRDSAHTVTRDEPDGRSGASWDDTLSASPHIGCWRFSDAGDGDDGVGGKAGEQAREETVGEQVGPFGLGGDSDELSDDVEDGARRQRKKDDADRLAGEAVPDGGADEGGTAADQAEGGKERPAGPGCVGAGVGGQGGDNAEPFGGVVQAESDHEQGGQGDLAGCGGLADRETLGEVVQPDACLLYTSPSPRDRTRS